MYRDKIVNVRLSEKKKPKKERNFVIVEGFKLAANGIIKIFKNIYYFTFILN